MGMRSPKTPRLRYALLARMPIIWKAALPLGAEVGLPTRRKAAASDKWVTRERPKADRIACPWLVRRFIGPEPTLLYATTARVFAVAQQSGAARYDRKPIVRSPSGNRKRCRRRFDGRLQEIQLLKIDVRYRCWVDSDIDITAHRNPARNPP